MKSKKSSYLIYTFAAAAFILSVTNNVFGRYDVGYLDKKPEAIPCFKKDEIVATGATCVTSTNHSCDTNNCPDGSTPTP